MLSNTEQRSLITRLMIPSVAASLLKADAAGREALLKTEIRSRFAALPPICRASLNNRADDLEMKIARELCEYRMPLMDGTSIPMGLPYDWYYGVNDGHLGGKAPAFIVPRIAFSGTLARASRRTGDPVFARALHAYIMDYVNRYWIDAATLPEHDNWLCTSCRCGTWYDERFGGLYAALSDPALLEPFSFCDLLAVFRAIDNMITGLIPNLALGSNWRVHELSNIFTQGFAYPFLKNSGEWLTLAATSLNEEFHIQFHSDGSHEELCVEYGTGTWRVFTQYYALAQQAPETGLSFDADKMRRCLQYYLSARKPFGLVAAIGDAYEIRSAASLSPSSPPHPADQPPEWDSSLRRGAECLSGAAKFPEIGYILEGNPEPAWTTRFNPVSGHLFMRNGWRTDSLYAALNMGWYANCHCHYGLLGLEVAGYGREFIVDAGCSALDPRPVNANLARTRAHNTLCVDGLDQQVAAPVQVSRLFNSDRYDFAVGVYKGGYTLDNPYGPGCTSAGRFDHAFSGTHYRHVLFVKGSYWVVFDALATRPGHVAETRFHFPPNDMKALPGGGYRTGWPHSNLALLPLQWDGWAHALHQGEEHPIEGWIPRPGGSLIPAPVYKATRSTDTSPLWHGSLLFPYREADLPAIRITPLPLSHAGFGYKIEFGDNTDYLFVSNSWANTDIALDEAATNAPLLHLRLRKGKPVQACTCDGTWLSLAGREIFRAPGTMLAREIVFDDQGRSTMTMFNPRVTR
jgi:hypothetical protein